MTYERFMEKLTMSVAWMLPRKLAYWSAIRVIAHATQASSAIKSCQNCSRWTR